MSPEEKRYLKELLAMNEMFLRQTFDSIDYKQFADGLLQLSGARYLLIIVAVDNGKKAKVVSFSGLSKGVQTVSDMLGFQVVGKEWDVQHWAAVERMDSKLASYNDLHKVSDGAVSRSATALIKKTLGIGDIFSMALFDAAKQVVADIVFAMPVNGLMRNPEVLELYAGQLSLQLMRFRAEQALTDNEEKYRLIADNTVDAIWVMDMNLVFQYVNPIVEQMTGYTEEEWIGSKLSDHCDAENFAIMIRGVEDGLSSLPGLSGVTFEAEMIKKNGASFPVEIRGRIILDAEGQVVGLQGVTRDITERKKAEKDLQREHNEKNAILNNLVEQVIYLDLDFKIIWANPAVAEAHDMQPEQYLGLRCYEAWHDRKTPCVNCPIEKVKETGKVYTGETSSPDGRIWMTTGSPVWGDCGSMIGVLDTALDITDLKKAEDDLKELNAALEKRVEERTAELERLIMELNAFTYSVSHDLRAPLRGIDGFSQIVLEDYGHLLNEEGKGYLVRICSASQRMGDLIDDLLKLSRVSRHDLQLEQVDLSMLAQEGLNEIREKEPQREIEVTISPNLVVRGDRSMLRIAIDNLLENAWKFTAAVENPRIEFGFSELNGQATFYISDNGAGFDMAYSDKLFVPFQRLHSPHDYPGTGIGLSIVSRIIRRHGGEIWAEGQTGRGATFYFTMPSC